MRLLHVVPTYLPAVRYGGPIFSVHNLCKALAARGHDVHVFTTNVDGAGNSPVPTGKPVDLDGVRVTYFASLSLRRLFRAPAMKPTLEQRVGGFDFVHLHSVFLWPTYAAARAAERHRIPYLIAPRGILSPELVRTRSRWAKSLWLRVVERHSLEHAAGIHVTSRREAKELDWLRTLGYRLPPVHIVPNAVDLEIFDAPSDQAMSLPSLPEADIDERKVILYLGRLSWKKNLNLIIKALPSVPDARFVMAGNDDEELQPKLEAEARSLGVADRVTFTGPVYGEDKAALLRSAAVFALPSRSENFSNSVLEAMAAGCPVVVSPEVGLADEVHASGSGLVVEAQVEEMGRAIRSILENPSLHDRMAASGRILARQRFSLESVGRQMEGVYEKILNEEPFPVVAASGATA